MLLAALKAISPCPNWKRACPVSTTHASVLEPINDILREGLENWKFSHFLASLRMTIFGEVAIKTAGKPPYTLEDETLSLQSHL